MFALLMLFLCVILHTMSSGKSMQLLCILPFGMWCLSVGGECVGDLDQGRERWGGVMSV